MKPLDLATLCLFLDETETVEEAPIETVETVETEENTEIAPEM